MVQREHDRWGWLHAGSALLLACLVPLHGVGATRAAGAPTGESTAPHGSPSATLSFIDSAVDQPQVETPAADADVPGADAIEPQTLQVTAVGLRAEAPEAETLPTDILVLVDTSASQTGAFKTLSEDIVAELLPLVSAGDRVRVAAIDITCEPLSDGFAAATAAETQQAMTALQKRTPLGSTDFVRGLTAAAGLFDADANRARRIIYVGDGPGLNGTAPLPFKGMLEQLRGEKIGFHAVAAGPMVNWPCLAAIANATGGTVILPDEGGSSAEVAASMSRMVSEPIFWAAEAYVAAPHADVASATAAATEGETVDAVTYSPMVLPPLRRDRDTVAILIGPVEDMRLGMTLETDARGEQAAEGTELALPSVAPSSDNAYLIELARNAWSTGGIFLPTLGRDGLERAKLAIRSEAATLAALSQQAEAAGDRDSAIQLAEASLRRDPDNPVASVLRAVSQVPSDAGAATEEPSSQLPEPVAPAAGTGNDGETLATDDATFEFDRMRKVITQALEQETAVRLRDARKLMATDPEAAREGLKSLLLDIDAEFADARLPADVRERLARQIEMRVREADRRAREKAERDLIAQREEASRREREALLGDLERKQDRLVRLASRYDALVKEGIRMGYEQPTTNFTEAERDVARQFAEEAPRIPTDPVVPMNARVLADNLALYARIIDYDAESMRLRRDSQRAFMDCLHLCDVAAIPFPDEPPVLYPSAARWREITRMREKYKAVDLANPGSAEEKIYRALEQPVENFDFVETPLRDVVAQIEDAHGIQVEIDARALEDFGLDIDQPVTRSVSGISLRSALRLILSEIDLAYIIKDEVMMITTQEEAENNLVLKVYPVADLVIPVGSGNGGVNPFQTGGGMGGMGGINSGQGMGGGGMGGMGMGGMGGGMFQVADARSREPRIADAGVTSSVGDSVTESSDQTDAPTPRRLPDSVLSADDLGAALRAYLGAPIAIATPDNTAEVALLHKKLVELRLSAAAFGRVGDFDQASDLLAAAIGSGHGEPWMYESLAVSLEAAGRPASEVERALLSAADFASSTNDLFALAQCLARFGLTERALDVCRQVVTLDPQHREAYAMAMSLAEKADDVEALAWACSGVLMHDWPTDQKELELRAARLARATIRKLEEDARDEDATFVRAVIDSALVRDVEFTISWSGEADVDLIVEEPTGAVCSVLTPVSTSGATLLADEDGEAGSETHRERYVVAEAFPGKYRLLVRRVWGEVAADTVTAEMVLHRGTDREERLKRQLVIGGEDLFLEVNVPEGRRTGPIQDAQVARIVDEQAQVGRAVLAQQLNALADPSAEYSLSQSRGASGSGSPVLPPFGRGGVVGYQPTISTLPDGANLSAVAVVSADRRYVRVTPTPLFSGVGQVSTFNFASGGAQGTGGMGGMGGGMGGMGGGMGGMGGGMGGMGGMGMGGMGGMM